MLCRAGVKRITGAAMVAAPFLRGVISTTQTAQVANTGVPVGRPAPAQAGKVGHGGRMVEVRQRQGPFNIRRSVR